MGRGLSRLGCTSSPYDGVEKERQTRVRETESTAVMESLKCV